MDFNFISDEQFRASLNADYCELQACAEAESWKAVHVLAGSIVEALLTEYLVVSGNKPNGKDPLKLTLDEAIQACQTASVLQRSTASLCDVIREYRNLIHPGRMIRLSQEVTPEGGRIALNLVSLIVKEVAEKRKTTYGLTAEQIVRKLRTDEHSVAVLPQFLQETNPHERVKLVKRVIPEAYATNEADFFQTDPEFLSRLRIGYRKAFDLLPRSTQVEIASDFVKKIRQDSSESIASYGEAFFVASDVALLSPQDMAIVVGYLKNRFELSTAPISDGILRQTVTLGCHIETTDTAKFADTIIRHVLNQPDASSMKVMSFAGEVFDALDDERKAIFEKRIEAWIKFAEEKDYSAEKKDRLGTVQVSWWFIPF